VEFDRKGAAALDVLNAHLSESVRDHFVV
jgi:hypothetical protein